MITFPLSLGGIGTYSLLLHLGVIGLWWWGVFLDRKGWTMLKESGFRLHCALC